MPKLGFKKSNYNRVLKLKTIKLTSCNYKNDWKLVDLGENL